jgi:hypothetical protein
LITGGAGFLAAPGTGIGSVDDPTPAVGNFDSIDGCESQFVSFYLDI